MKMFSHVIATGVLVFIFFQIACENQSLNGLEDVLGSVKLSIRRMVPTNFTKLEFSLGNAITITSARVIIEKIKFKSSLVDSLDFRFRQPFVQDLNSLDTLFTIENIPMPFGTYKETEIEIDDLEPEDGQVYFNNPELQDLSIRITGYLHGDTAQSFIFTSSLSAKQEREFNPPIVLDENSPSTNVVLLIDMASWFVDANGQVLDPRDPANYQIIEDNIKASIDIFEDEDDDGHRDDHDD